MPAAAPDPPTPRRRWRDYRTASGRSPVGEFIASLSDREAASVVGHMQEVSDRGLAAARHLQDDIWEVRAQGNRAAYRVLFAQEGERGRVLLSLEAFSKKTQKTPDRSIDLATRRLADWRHRGGERRHARGTAPRQSRQISVSAGRPTRGLDR